MNPHYIPQTHITTVGSTFINLAITPNDRLRKLTHVVLLADEPRGLTARVFRESFSEPGHLSFDVFAWKAAEKTWEHWRKESGKYPQAPVPPEGSVKTLVDGFEVWTAVAPSEAEVSRLRDLIFVLKPPSDTPRRLDEGG